MTKNEECINLSQKSIKRESSNLSVSLCLPASTHSSSSNNITTTTIISTIKAKWGIIVCFVLFFEIYPASSLGRETLLRDSGGQLISRKCISMVPKQKRVSQEAPLYCRWSSSSGRKRPVAAAPTIRGFTVRIQLFAS